MTPTQSTSQPADAGQPADAPRPADAGPPTDASDLTGRVALVTGASRGIGRATALALARAGAHVAVGYHQRAGDAEEVRAAIEALGRRAVTAGADVARADDVARMVTAVTETLGAPAILVNNAGVAHTRSIDELTEADWDETLAVNLKSAFLVTQAVLPAMRAAGWGRIINVSSAAAHLGGIIGPHYTASKAGMLGLSRAYARALAGEGITVNAVTPGLIATEMIAGNPRAAPERIPVKRLGGVDEVAAVVLMLARNGYMTGQTVGVDGGLHPS